MKYLSTILSVVALGLGVFLLVRNPGQKEAAHAGAAGSGASAAQAGNGASFKIAYFDMDSLEAHYDYFKDAQSSVKTKESAMNLELASMDRKNQKQVEEWRQKGNTMTQAEGEKAQQEYAAMQQNFQTRKQALEQELYKNTEDLKTNIRRKIEDFLKDYNKDKKYAFIFAYDPGSFIYAKDSIYNVTGDLLDGLNSAYKKK